jgi:hypothetical protein
MEKVGAVLPTELGSRDFEGEDLGLEDGGGSVVGASTLMDVEAEAEASCRGGGNGEDTEMTGPF